MLGLKLIHVSKRGSRTLVFIKILTHYQRINVPSQCLRVPVGMFTTNITQHQTVILNVKLLSVYPQLLYAKSSVWISNLHPWATIRQSLYTRVHSFTATGASYPNYTKSCRKKTNVFSLSYSVVCYVDICDLKVNNLDIKGLPNWIQANAPS